MLMDLDRFKEINDALGHDVGDDVLVEVGTRLQRCLGVRGVVARLGGDEFAVLLPRITSGADALTVAEDLKRELAHAIRVGDLTLNTKASIGIALAPEHGDATKTLLQHADIAMYAAKGTVEGVQFYDRAHDRNTPRRLALIADLQNAIELRELRVAFQPKADVRSGAAVGAEALARWDHPEYGVIPPDEFIPIAEHTGMIRGLTLHVLEVALRECATWRRSGHDLSVAVNVSPSGLLDTSFPDDVTRLLALVGVPAEALILEITETSIMSDPTRVRVVLDRLNALGVKLSIDDFGTGYSSLGRHRELPIHEVKIDRSFVRDLASNQDDQALVRSAIQLGHALGLRVVAEGVEDEHTLAYLSAEGCDLVQGYFVSRPVPAAQFVEWLQTSPWVYSPTGS
jgi:diguanylate cyclase (GGDEF)-like protein